MSVDRGRSELVDRPKKRGSCEQLSADPDLHGIRRLYARSARARALSYCGVVSTNGAAASHQRDADERRVHSCCHRRGGRVLAAHNNAT